MERNIIKNTPISITICGNGQNDIAASFMLIMEKERYLFNIPEGTQRLFMENKLKLPRINHLLFTSDNPIYWNGYPGSLLTYYATEFPYTPIHCTKNFLENINQSEMIPYSNHLFSHIKEITSDTESFFDDHFTFIPVVTECQNIKTINYHILLPTFLGKFDAAKANQLKIPGSLRGKLMKGETITLDNGMIINQSDVCGNPIFPGYLVVLHLPSIEHVNEYLKQQIKNEVCCFVIITNNQVRQYQPFIDFIGQYPKAQTIYLQDTISLSGSEIVQNVNKTSFRLANDLHKALGTLLPTFAPDDMRKENISDKVPTKQELQQITPALIQYTIYPKVQITPIKKDTSFIIPSIPALNMPLDYQQKFQVILLGTGGAVPGKSRNVSGSILKYNNQIIMIDIGESTIYSALNAGINPDDITLLYITHAHGDHVFGIMSFFKLRTKPLTVIAPFNMEKCIQSLSQYFNVPTTFVSNAIFSQRNEYNDLIQLIEQQIQSKIITKRLHHHEENYGVRFEFNDTSIVFTGDTKICNEDKELCMNVDYVIHECNFEDGMEDEAINRSHSTPFAIQEGLKDCNNKVIIMNHIGQRTSKFSDITNKEYSLPMIYSFDGMVFDNSLEITWNQYKLYLHKFFTLNEIDENE